MSALLGEQVWMSGSVRAKATYATQKNDQKDPYPKEMPRRFSVLFADSESERDRKIKHGEFTPINDAVLNLPAGKSVVYSAVRDQWDNTIRQPSLTMWAVPGPMAVAGLTAVCWLLALTAVLALAPWKKYPMEMLMSPVLRNYGSFGIIPLLFAVIPPLRHYLLQRYVRELRVDQDIQPWGDKFIPPSPEY